jgi:uncharacterized protein
MDFFETAFWSLVCFVIAAVVLTAILRLFRLRSLWSRVALGMALLGGLLLVDMYFVEPNWIAVERVTIRNARLAAVLNDIRVVQISDLHVDAQQGFREASLVRTVNALEPDLLLITGDFINDREGKASAVEVVRQFTSKVGKYGVPGNNDNYRYKPGEMRKLFPTAGMTILVNENRRIPLPNGQILNLAGVNDPVTGQARIEAALAGIPDGEPVVMLAHSPEFLPVAAGRSVDLLLVGHTHGGQIGWPWLVRLFRVVDDVDAIEGLHLAGQTAMYVNRGIGTTTLPFRFLCRPEVTLFEFVY